MPELRVESDLTLTVEGLRATVTADGGAVLTVRSDDVGRLLALAGRTSVPVSDLSGRAVLAQVGRALDDAGLSARVVGRDEGTVLAIGRGCGSVAGRLITGSRHAQLGGPRALGPVLRGYLAGSVQWRRPAAVVGGVVLGAVWIRSRSRDRAGRGFAGTGRAGRR